MPVKVKIKSYLEELKEAQQHKPMAERGRVPSYTDFAKALNSSRQAVYGFINRDEHKQLNTEMLDGILSVIHAYGYVVSLNDVVEWTPSDVDISVLEEAV